MLECFFKFDMQAVKGGELIAWMLKIRMVKCWFGEDEDCLSKFVLIEKFSG
jgi:hypothetical protein